jgi:hypothetical protein
MKNAQGNAHVVNRFMAGLSLIFLLGISIRNTQAQELSLQAVVTPSTLVLKDGKTVTFAIHGFIEFRSLEEVFPYIEGETRRWEGKITEKEKQQLARQLLREGIESRVISMADERPLEALVTHTSEELRQAIARVKEPLPAGYAEAFVAVEEKWKHSLNCWRLRR